MNVTRYEPRYRSLGLLGRLLQDNELKSLLDQEPDAATDWLPAVDIREDADCYVIAADLPGVDPNNIDVTMKDGILTLRGNRDDETSDEKSGYRRYERVRGSFMRQFTLPDTTNGDDVAASARNGVLQITIPKQPKLQPRRIDVKQA